MVLKLTLMEEVRQDELLALLTNEDFKKWVLEPTYERDVFWNKWMEQHPGKQELVLSAKKFIRTRKFNQLSFSAEEKDNILSTIISKTNIATAPGELQDHNILEEHHEGRKRVLWALFYKVAAVLAFIAVFSGIVVWNLKNKPTSEHVEELTFIKKENPQGRKSVIRLPDGTKVTLNSSSRLVYDSNYGDTDRTVRIEGEAFFEVFHDEERPFNVVSNDVITTALGTSFNVRAFENESALGISLQSGKVKVALASDYHPSNEHLLSPGEGYVITKQTGEIKKISVDPVKVYGWKDGILFFEDNNLMEIVHILERWYDVKILVTGAPEKSWKADGKFDNESLEKVLKSLSYTYDMKFEIHDKDVELKFN